MTHIEAGSANRLLPVRRRLLSGAGLVLSATAVALLGGREGLAAGSSGRETEADLRILNTALAAEREAIAAYQLGADSGLLTADVRKLAIRFQSHHKEHADALAATVRKLGGTVVAAKADHGFPTDKLRSQGDVLQFAAGLEKGAVSAFLGAVPLFADRQLAQVAASILGDEAMHWAVLRQALGQDPVPAAFLA